MLPGGGGGGGQGPPVAQRRGSPQECCSLLCISVVWGGFGAHQRCWADLCWRKKRHFVIISSWWSQYLSAWSGSRSAGGPQTSAKRRLFLALTHRSSWDTLRRPRTAGGGVLKPGEPLTAVVSAQQRVSAGKRDATTAGGLFKGRVRGIPRIHPNLRHSRHSGFGWGAKNRRNANKGWICQEEPAHRKGAS